MQFEETAFWLSEIMPAQLELRQVNGARVGTVMLNDGRALAATADFADTDTGLVTDDEPQRDVRCELMVTAQVSEAEAASAVLAAAAVLQGAGGMVPARPGILLPRVGEAAGLAGASVAHGLLMAPRLWGEQTPHVAEENRMTLMLEVVMLIEEEYQIGVQAGVDTLLRRLRRRGADLDDWRRE